MEFHRTLYVLIPFIIWYQYISFDRKIFSLLVAIGFGIIEYVWYSTTTISADGTVVKFTPFSKTCRKGFTTFAMFWTNILYSGVIIMMWHELWKEYPVILRIILQPICIWLIEIIIGYHLILVYNRNVAWQYKGKYAMFHGNITLSHWHLWMLIGVVLEIYFYFV